MLNNHNKYFNFENLNNLNTLLLLLSYCCDDRGDSGLIGSDYTWEIMKYAKKGYESLDYRLNLQ